MKRITLFSVLLAMSAITYSQTTLPCPLSFKRSNGAGMGCPIARITFSYGVCPAVALPIDSVYQNGVKINATFAAGVIDCSGSKNEVYYCVTSTNIAPTVQLTIYFHAFGSYDGSVCQVDGGGPAPVKLSSFFVNRKGGAVAISWKSETEINSKEYIIQRKIGSDWVDIATVASANRENGNSYFYSDNNSSKGTSQYRLKMVDFDAVYSNSEIRTVKGNGSVSDFTVFPNPSAGNAKVTVSDISEPTDVQLIDNSGRVLKTVSMNNNSSVELNNLQKGMYMIRLVNKASGDAVTKKLTVVN
ncbi:MAG TPA: T9SS type A sorting domain-containing protein [Ferruginibacter sp.]|nr:T9SS type A sorting domain-containing protein [Ferruginibacter sp.]